MTFIYPHKGMSTGPRMSIPLILGAYLILLSIFTACQSSRHHSNILIFAANQEDSINYLGNSLEEFAISHTIKYHISSDLSSFSEDSLSQYSSILIQNLRLKSLDAWQINALQRYVEAGGQCIAFNCEAEGTDRYRSSFLFQGLGQKENLEMPLNRGNLISYQIPNHIDTLDQNITESILALERSGSTLEYDQVKTSPIPPEHWFEVDTLTMPLNEPMELEVTEEGNVLFIERGGMVKIYSPSTDILDTIGKIPVLSTQSNGLNGMALDPDYPSSKLIYFSYLSESDSTHQRISRFKVQNGKLDLASEEIIMEIPIIKSNGWHGTNSIEFDSRANLYISLGDFTVQTSDVAGYAQIDERPKMGFHDSQRTAANSNTYPGKILRIHPESDGSYTIPEGNLFPPGTADTQPEIYVMGCRNPYRFVLDPHTDVLYFGDVGPDAWDNGEKGPRGYDELNVAPTASFFGWPYCVADNKAYKDYDYDQNLLGDYFDPTQIINNSPNNTGLRNLPSATKSVLWYHKDESEQFPYLGSGGMNIMVGPKFYSEDYPDVPPRFPAHFDSTIFLYDWVRNWVNVVKLDPKSYEVEQIEPFMPSHNFIKIIDMKFGPDGSLYVLEYGNKGYAANLDASLKRIRYVEGRANPNPGNVKSAVSNSLAEMLPIRVGHEEAREILMGLPCFSCHRVDEKIIGPSFAQIAERYADEPDASRFLSQKIMNGGTGNWSGNIIMPANPNINFKEANLLSNYILSFSDLMEGH